MRDWQNCLVELLGLSDDSIGRRGAERLIGHVVRPEGRNWVVDVFQHDSPLTVTVSEENMRLYVPASAETGGFDLAWPSASSGQNGLQSFGSSMLDIVDEKGWCLIEMNLDDRTQREAVRLARTCRKYESLREEFVPDYLGRGGEGRTAFLDFERNDSLSKLDQNLSVLSMLFQSLSWDVLRLQLTDRSKALLWSSYASARQEEELRPEPLTDFDLDAGKVEEHIKFLKRRKIGLMIWLENSGGDLRLIPAPGSSYNEAILPLSTKKLLVYRADHLRYEYEPIGRSAVLQAWLLEAEPNFGAQLQAVIRSHQQKAQMMGITSGHPYPEGDRVHIMSCMTRLGGDADAPEKYWNLLLEGTDGMLDVPLRRWDHELYSTKDGETDPAKLMGKTYARHGCFCAHDLIYSFDNSFFGISNDDARIMGPTQRMVLEDAYSVLNRAGYTKASLEGSAVGFFLGDTGNDWNPFTNVESTLGFSGEKVQGLHPLGFAGASQEVTANRVSYLFDLRGPTATVDTACSSSLVAVGMAMSWLRPRNMPVGSEHAQCRIKEAIAGGVAVLLGPGSYIGMSGLGMLSHMGRCFTFDESGDGYARGEGCGMLYLRASEDEDDMLNQKACVLGSAVNQDGRSASMTAPNGPSQQVCIRASMREAGFEPRDINLAECHGTGTALGDPIEVGALRNAMEPRDTTLAITSSKSNIGHLEGGAGIAGLMKCVVMLMAGTCPPNAHCRQLNPHLSVAGFPCFFDTEAIDTHLNSALTGVSSFGFGGTNGRCDLWGQARFGQNKSGKFQAAEVDQLVIPCPVTMLPMDCYSGEPLFVPSMSRGSQYRADVLRSEFDSYDVSRHAYSGDFRYERFFTEATDFLESKDQVFIHGSWAKFEEPQEMQRQADGWYSATVAIGETGFECFNISVTFDRKRKGVEYDENSRIYPAIHRAGRRIAGCAFDSNSDGRCWLIDGRDEEVQTGTLYKVSFKWQLGLRQVNWERVYDASLVAPPSLLAFPHAYYAIGTFSMWKCEMMTATDDGSNWEFSFRTSSGHEEFQFWRDQDKFQAIYPAEHPTRVRGPDELGKGRHFQVEAAPGSLVTLRLSIADSKVLISVLHEHGSLEWQGVTGWARHSFGLLGTLHGGLVPMRAHDDKPWLFSCICSMSEAAARGNSYVDTFQVAIDGDIRHVYSPETDLAFPGEVIVKAPDGKGEGALGKFLLRSQWPGRRVRVFLDLRAEDRRKIVTFQWVKDLSIRDL